MRTHYRYYHYYLTRLATLNELFGTLEEPSATLMQTLEPDLPQIMAILHTLAKNQNDADPQRMLIHYLLQGSALLQLRVDATTRITLLKRAIKASADFPSGTARIRLFIMLGWAYYTKNEYRLAESVYQEALHSSDREDDEALKAEVLGNLARVYRATKRYEAALEYHLCALDLEKKHHNLRRQASTLGDIGNIYRHQHQLARAIDYYEASLRLHREVGDTRSEGIRLGNLGLAYATMKGEAAKAQAYYQQALAIAEALKDSVNQMLNTGNVANLLLRQQQYQPAERLYGEAVSIARSIGDRRHAALWLGHLGRLYGHLEQYERACTYYEQAIGELCVLEDTRYLKIHLSGMMRLLQKGGDRFDSLLSLQLLVDLASQTQNVWLQRRATSILWQRAVRKTITAGGR